MSKFKKIFVILVEVRENLVMAEERRKRGTNFSPQEKSTLLNLVHKYKKIVANNKTDAVSVSEKEKCWNKISDEFNAEAPNGIFRTKESLRRLYLNTVQNTRKAAAHDKREQYKTGGGVKEAVVKDSNYDLVLDIINKKTIEGLQNPFDSDGPMFSANIQESVNVETIEATNASAILLHDITETEHREEMLDLVNDSSRSPLRCPSPSVNTSVIVEECSGTATSGVPSKGRTKTSSVGPSKKKYDFSRRRPIITALSTSHIAEKYDKLLDLKLQIAQCDLERSKRQGEFEEQERALKLERLRVEIAQIKSQFGIN